MKFAVYALLGLLCLPLTLQAAIVADPAESAELARLIAARRFERLYHPSFKGYEDELATLYAGPTPSLRWFGEDGKPAAFARQLLQAFDEAEARGLRARDYDRIWLSMQLEAAQNDVVVVPGVARAQLDFALSVNFLRYVSDLHVGRVNPRHVGIAIDVEPKQYALAAEADAALSSGKVRELIDKVEPNFAIYKQLKAALIHYRRLADTVTEPTLDLSKRRDPGKPMADAKALFEYLTVLGDAEGLSAPTEERLDGDLLTAVKRFQERHGLQPDGVIGRGTADALAAPLEYRVRQIELNLERLRWLPDLKGQRAVVVNIPEFKLYAFDGGETPVFSMPVVVGQTVRWQTPVFLKSLRAIVLSPYWNVPNSIARKEYVSKLRADPAYVSKHGYELVGSSGVVGVNDGTIAGLANGSVRMRQLPGPKNALGGIKFDFPNDDAVYLHSTPAKALFAKDRRAFSHGCVRIEDPVRLAQFLLDDQPQWTPETITENMGLRQPKTVRLSKPVPVLLYYGTATIAADGRGRFFEDLYGYDARLDKAMNGRVSQ